MPSTSPALTVEQQEQHTGLALPSCHRSQAARQGRRVPSPSTRRAPPRSSMLTRCAISKFLYLYPSEIYYPIDGTHDGTHWLPNKEMTKLWEVSDETSTDRFPHFQCLTLQCDTSTLSLWSGRRGRLTSEVRASRSVDLGGQPRGRRGGVFSRKRHWISWTRFRPDPTRPDPDLYPSFISGCLSRRCRPPR